MTSNVTVQKQEPGLHLIVPTTVSAFLHLHSFFVKS